MNKKYLTYSFIFIASISLHSFADHHDHYSFEEVHADECQACEENVVVKVSSPNNKIFYKNIDCEEDVNFCLRNQRKKSNILGLPFNQRV